MSDAPSRPYPATEGLWSIFEHAHQKAMRECPTEPTKARRAGFDAMMGTFDPAQPPNETYRETVRRVAAAREKGYAAARANLQEAWSALTMIREAVETLAPSGSVKAAEHLDGPTFMYEAEALVAGILALSSVSSTMLCTPSDGGSK